MNKWYILGVAALLFAACNSNPKQRPIYYESGDIVESSDYSSYGNVKHIRFREEGGVKFVPVTINGVGLEMIFDTGCSGTLISLAEAEYLFQKGLLTEDDIVGRTHSMIADGSIVENMVITLKSVVIDDQILCDDVQATVSQNVNAPLLLGNEVLDRVATITIDNDSKELIFKLK